MKPPALAPEDFDAAIAEKDRAREVGDLHKVAKFWEPELDALHASESLADGGVPTEADNDARRRADEQFRAALADRIAEVLRGCGFRRVRVSSHAELADGWWRELKYKAEALDTEGRLWDCEIEGGPGKGGRLVIEHSREFLHGLADQIAAQLVMARDAYVARMVGRPVAEVASA